MCSENQEQSGWRQYRKEGALLKDFRTVLTDAVGVDVTDKDRELIQRLIEEAWNALQDGGDADTIREAVMSEVNKTLGEAQSALATAEKANVGN